MMLRAARAACPVARVSSNVRRHILEVAAVSGTINSHESQAQREASELAAIALTEATCMTRQLVSSGSTFEADIGYSRAVRQDPWVFVSGTTGFDYTTMTISDSLEGQTVQCLKNIELALKAADASLADVVRITYVLPTAADFPRCWPVLKKYFGTIRPAAMMISAGLADPRMQIEIEVTALKQQGS
jgi:enamine deaminase RidA (YjgF/YER057c/UK114 family)